MVSPAQDFTYDALYRLVRAEGREGIGLASFGSDDNWNDSGWMESVPMPSNTNVVQRYIQKYSYDKAGNILQLQHIADNGSFTRDFGIDTVSNRLKDTVVGSDTYSYTHDSRGNMTAMPHLSTLQYDGLNQMSYIESGTTKAWYQYSGGQRIRKMTDGGAERIYLGAFEYYRERDGSGVITLERTTVHVGDDSGRIAMLEVRTIGSDAAPASLKRFIYSNHLQSAALELDDTGAIISYEEYHPYGTTAYQAMNSDIGAVAKRYRFTGKERDEESGLSYHGARYYIPWLCRWAAVDPLESKYAGLSPYNYCFNNPVNYNDLDGKQGEKENGIQTFEVKDKYYDGRVVDERDILIPKDATVTTSSIDSSGNEVIPYVISVKLKSGELYSWNDSSKWLTNSKGESYSNPGFLGLMVSWQNVLRKRTENGIGQMAKDTLEKGNPFATVIDAFNDFVATKYIPTQGSNPVSSFIAYGIVHATQKTYEDIVAGGQRSKEAIISLWMGATDIARSATLASNTSGVIERDTKLINEVTKEVGLPARISKSGMSNAEAGRFFGWGKGIPTKSPKEFTKTLLEENGWTKDVIKDVAEGYRKIANVDKVNPSAIYRAKQLEQILKLF